MSTWSRSVSAEVSTSAKLIRMTNPPDPAALAAEKEMLPGTRTRSSAGAPGYLRLSGPGYLQTAMTLGGGTAFASLFAGAAFGYQLLWVAPLAMLIGIIVLSAIAPDPVDRREPVPGDAAPRRRAARLRLGLQRAPVLDHLALPAVRAGSCVAVDIGAVAGFGGLKPSGWAWSCSSGRCHPLLYGATPRLVRLVRAHHQVHGLGVVLCFGWVVFQTGISDWGALLRGFLSFESPARTTAWLA